MERQQGNGIFALIGAAAVVVVAALVGLLIWDEPAANGTTGQSASAPPIASKLAVKPETGAAAPEAASPQKPKEDQQGKPANDKPSADQSSADKASVMQNADKPPKAETRARPEEPAAKPDKPPADDKGKTETRARPEEPAAKPDKPPVDDKGKADNAVPAPDSASPPVEGSADAAARPVAAPPPAAPPAKPPVKPGGKVVYPSFDHVRIEPNGENVFAGRVASGATVEMIRDGQVYARAVADTSGLFAFSAPPLPVGASQIYLRSIAPDGTRESSRESVTVMIDQDKTDRPLVALTSPDKPTVVLSNPDSPDTRKPEGAENTAGKTPGQAAARPQIKIVSVEARDGGRLYVSGHAAPGASVRLFLNGTMVAPGGADSEGNLSFTIARGMAAGSYLVRLDDVDPVSGQLKSKAEVSFTVPDLPAYQAGAGEEVAAAPPEDAVTAVAEDADTTRKATVERGDSLWSISERYYGSGYLYLEVYDANMRKIKNPNTIYPGQVLTLPPLEVPKHK